MIIDDVDFAGLYRAHIKLASRKPKQAGDWDERAIDMGRSCADPENPYVRAFVSRMQIDGAETLLDVGCGPGTICLPLAPRFKEVYALDYSVGMLDVLKQRAANEGLTNVHCLQKSWDDAWDDVPACDIVVASRSTMVNDMEDGLKKLNAKARRYVYTTHTVDRHFIAEGIMECLGRSAVGFPNYIYTVNLLHQMGYLPQVDFITTDAYRSSGQSGCKYQCRKKDAVRGKREETGFETFIKSVEWSIGALSEDEIVKLKDYYEVRGKNDPMLTSRSRTWAFVSWQTSR